MTAFAISSGGTEYFDQKTGGSVNATLDTYTISNGSKFVIRTDTYACLNHSTAWGSLDNVAFSGIGGEVEIDPTYTRHVEYTGGSGNSPAFGATISQGGVSGVFLGAWADWQSEPTTQGSAIPASGYIKIGGITGGAFAAGALTGITATCSGADVQSWIEVRSSETAVAIVSRIGKFSSVGAWFELGVTSGSRGQVIPCPTTATFAGVWAGVFIETSAGSGVYDRFWGAGSQVPLSTTPTDARGKFVWQTTSGLVLGFDGTNNVGYLPAAGCKIRIPAAILTSCTRTSGNGSGHRVLPNTTLTTRPKFDTSYGGMIDFTGVVMQWYADFLQASAVSFQGCIINDTLRIVKVLSPDITNCIVAPTQTKTWQTLTLQYCNDAQVTDSVFCRFSLPINNDNTVSVAWCDGLDLLRVTSTVATDRISETRAYFLLANTDVVMTDCVCIGAQVYPSNSTRITINNLRFADRLVATTTANGQSAINSVADTELLINGVSLLDGIANVHPYNSMVYLETTRKGTVKNIGTYATPLNGGSANLMRYVAEFAGGVQGIKFQRCYATNTRTAAFYGANNIQGLTLEHVYGDYSDEALCDVSELVVKSCGLTWSTNDRLGVRGTHWSTLFTSTTAGIINFMCNEPTPNTVGQFYITAGVPVFDGTGRIGLTVVGDQFLCEMPFFALGITALANSPLTFSGGGTGNHSFEFQYDLGAGYNGTWLTANGANLSGVGAINPATGIKIKLRVTCTTANVGNSLGQIRIITTTTLAAQGDNLYPLDQVTLTLTGLISGSDVVVRAAGTSTILASVDSNAGTTWGYVYETPVAVDIDVIKAGYVVLPLLRNYTPSTSDSSVPVAQLIDRNYL